MKPNKHVLLKMRGIDYIFGFCARFILYVNILLHVTEHCEQITTAICPWFLFFDTKIILYSISLLIFANNFNSNSATVVTKFKYVIQ